MWQCGRVNKKKERTFRMHTKQSGRQILHCRRIVIKESLSRDQFRLYQLIWKRFTASRMAKSEYETTTVKLSVGDYVFSFATSRLLFDGFELAYTAADDDKERKQPVT